MNGETAVMDKLRKLMRHEESAREIGSIAEAEAFAAKIQQLLIEHKLEMSEVKASDDHDTERDDGPVDEQKFDPTALGIPYSGRQRVAWIEDLASVIARAHFCRILVMNGTTSIWFVGKAQDRAVTGYVFSALVKAAIAQCDSAYNRARSDPWADTKGFRRSFYSGFVGAIRDRLYQQRKAADATTSTALVLANADGAVQAYMKKHSSKASSIGSSSTFNRDGFSRGQAAGQRASMAQGAIGGGPRGRIGGGS